MDDIVQGMFGTMQKRDGSTPAADPINWFSRQTIVAGGINHQHQHCDTAKTGAYTYEELFPFVAIHGFGENTFDIWLLPQQRKREYGSLYRFPKTSVLFMRGDFVHAGGCSQPSRAHLEFYPYHEAGWTATTKSSLGTTSS